MDTDLAVFGPFTLVRDAQGREGLVYCRDGSVSALDPTVDESADEADESPSRSSEHDQAV